MSVILHLEVHPGGYDLAAQQGLHLYGLDIFGAFITAEIDTPDYVQQPKGLNPDDPDDQPSNALSTD